MPDMTRQYTATSVGEHSRLEEAMGKFLKSYEIQFDKCTGVGIRTGHDDCVKISPLMGEVTEIYPIPGEDVPRGTVERLTPQYKFVRLNLEGTVFQVDFDNTVTA